MLKSSPLKHKKGDAMAHTPYATEEAYHENKGNDSETTVEDKKTEEVYTVDGYEIPEHSRENDGKGNIIIRYKDGNERTIPDPDYIELKPAFQVFAESDAGEDYRDELIAKQQKKVDEVNEYKEENNIDFNDAEKSPIVVENGIPYVKEKDGSRSMLNGTDHPELAYAFILEQMDGNTDLADSVFESYKKKATIGDISKINENINNFLTISDRNNELIKNPQLIESNRVAESNTTAVHIPVVNLLEGDQVSTEDKEVYEYQDLENHDYYENFELAKKTIAEKRGVSMVTIDETDPEVVAEFKRLVMAAEIKNVYNERVKEEARKKDRETEGNRWWHKNLTSAIEESQKGDLSYLLRGMEEKGVEMEIVETTAEIMNNQLTFKDNLTDAQNTLMEFSNEDSQKNQNIKQLIEEAEAIKDKKYTTEEEVAAANKRLQEIQTKLTHHQNAYNIAYNDYEMAFDAWNGLVDDIEIKMPMLLDTKEGMELWQETIDKDHGLFSNAALSLTSGSADILLNLENALYKTPVTAWAYKGILKNLDPEVQENVEKLKSELLKDGKLSQEEIDAKVDELRTTSMDKKRDKWRKDTRRGVDYLQGSMGDFSESDEWWYKAGGYTANAVAGFAPQLLGMTLAAKLGGPVGLHAFLYGMIAGGKYEQQDNDIEQWKNQQILENPEFQSGMRSLVAKLESGDLNQVQFGKAVEKLKEQYKKDLPITGPYESWRYHLLPTVSGVIGMASERFTMRQLGFLGKAKVKPKGVFASGFKSEIGRMFKPSSLVKGLRVSHTEGWTEVADGLGQNILKKYFEPGHEDINLFSGLHHDYLNGAIVSKFYFRAPLVFNQTINAYRSSKSMSKVDDLRKRKEEISKVLSSGRTNKVVKDQLYKEISKIDSDIQKVIRNDIQNFDLYSRSEKETLTDISLAQNDLKKSLKEVELNKNLDKKERQTQIKKLHDDYYKLEDAKEDLVGVYNRAYETNKEEKINTETIKKHNKKIFDDKIEVVEATSQENSAELMELSLQERKVAIVEEHTRKGIPLTQDARAEINQINDDLAKIDDINKRPGQKSLAGGALTAYGYITPRDQAGRQKIILNKKAALKDGFVTTAQHEFLHAITHETLKNDPKVQKSMGEALRGYIGDITTGSLAETELAKRMMSYTQNEGVFNEETLNLLSEAMVRENLPFKKERFEGVKDFFRRFGQNYLEKDIQFNTGKDVYNFLKDYNYSVKSGNFNNAIGRMAREGAGGTLVEDAVSRGEQMKMSKAASDNVQAIYNEKGIDGAFDIINEFNPIVGKLVEKRREAPGFDRELLTSEIQYGKRGIFDLIKEYNPASGVPLAAYINKYLPSRAIEASRKVLNEEFTDDVSERIDIADDSGLPAFEETTKLKTSKTLLSERFNVQDDVNKAVKKALKNIDIKDITFKNTPIFTNDIIGELFGINPKKLETGANLTKGELQSAQMFINKNADVLRNMLPDGATASGTSTGVQNVLLKEFYTKTERAQMSKTGTKAGLPIQIKNENINKNSFLQPFGIIDGKPVRDDRNTSARVLALAKQTSRMMSNQAVRQELIDKNAPLESIQIIADGKSEYMFSNEIGNGIIDDRVEFYAGLPALYTMYKNSGNSVEGAFNKLYSKDIFGKKRKKVIQDIDRFIKQYETVKKTHDKVGSTVKSVEDFIIEELTESANKESMKQIIGLGKNSLDFRDKQQLDSWRDSMSELAHEIGWEKAQRFLPFLYASGKIGATKFAHVDGVGLVEDALFDQKLIDKGKRKQPKELESTRYGGYRGVNDFNTNILSGLKDWNDNNVNTISKDATQSVNVDVSTPALAKVNRDSANINKEFLVELMDVSKKLISQGKMNKNDLGMLMMSLAGDMRTPLAAAAHVGYTTSGPINSKTHRYEHIIPRKVVGLFLANYAMGKTKKADIKKLLNQYSVAIIPKIQDDVINDIGYQDSMPADWLLGTDVLKRYFNSKTFGKINLRLTDVTTGEINPKSEAFAKAYEAINPKADSYLKFSKAINKARIPSEPKGITVLDFDDTLATTKSRIRFTKPDGTKGSLNAEQYARDYVELSEQGYKWDFSEFSQVVGGETAPLFNKALKLAGKFTTKDMFVLTARPAESAMAIQEFLKANGLSIPLKNITGLGNSTSEAKALWIADKVGEGYNDFYFADDALQNVQAVKNMLDQFDVKSKVQQAKVKFSKNLNNDFNKILEETTGFKKEQVFSRAKAQKRGAKKGKWKLFIPPSHEDFTGLLYSFLTKGKKGEQQMKWFEEALVKPLNRAYTELNSAKQAIANDYKALKKKFPDARKKLTKKTPDGDFIFDDAVRIYLWDKNGFDVPGLSKADQKKLSSYVKSDPNLQAFADGVGIITKQETGYVPPSEYWLTEDIRNDLETATGKIGRAEYFAPFVQNAETIFSKENLNKIEAIYGSNFREALEDVLYRTTTGNNRNFGKNRLVNQFQDFLNGSIGATMFFNARSAVLQTLSTVNFINWSDNNPIKAAAAFANQKQFWKDFAYIFNSDTLKQRRGGLQQDINASELTSYVSKSKSPVRAGIKWILQKGFLPTQIADSFAISTGGATFYRNRVNKYVKEGMNKKNADQKAWEDFIAISEATQQSARPDMISQQQASPLGRMILAFQNTPSQYARIIKKSALDLANGRGDFKTNVSKILYYGAAQNLIFMGLQSALFAMMFSDDEEDEEFFAKKKHRVANGMIDSLLRGMGLGGAVVSTVKNMIFKYQEQQGKQYGKDPSAVLVEGLNLSPPIGIKARKIVSAQKTLDYNKDVIKEMETFNVENPVYNAIGNIIEATTNIPLARIHNKVMNLRESMNNENAMWQRVALMLGWNRWDVRVDRPQSVEDAKKSVKKKKQTIKNNIKKQEQEIEEQKQIEENIKKQENEKKEIEKANKKKEEEKEKKKLQCAAVNKHGKRCSSSVQPGKSFCTVHEKVEQNDTGKKSQCSAVKSNGKRCKMQTSSKSGNCYYHD